MIEKDVSMLQILLPKKTFLQLKDPAHSESTASRKSSPPTYPIISPSRDVKDTFAFDTDSCNGCNDNDVESFTAASSFYINIDDGSSFGKEGNQILQDPFYKNGKNIGDNGNEDHNENEAATEKHQIMTTTSLFHLARSPERCSSTQEGTENNYSSGNSSNNKEGSILAIVPITFAPKSEAYQRFNATISSLTLNQEENHVKVLYSNEGISTVTLQRPTSVELDALSIEENTYSNPLSIQAETLPNTNVPGGCDTDTVSGHEQAIALPALESLQPLHYPSLPWRLPSRFLSSSAHQPPTASCSDSVVVPSNASFPSERTIGHDDDIGQITRLSSKHYIIHSIAAPATAAGVALYGSTRHFSDLIMSTGYATFDYLTNIIAPGTINLASSITDYFWAYLPAITVPHPLQTRDYSHELEEQKDNRNNSDGSGENNHDIVSSVEQPQRSEHKKQRTERRTVTEPTHFDQALSITSNSTHLATFTLREGLHRNHHSGRCSGPIVVAPAHKASHKRRQRGRRFPLQTLPGPEHLDPEIRRQLEAEGLVSLRLYDGTEARHTRSHYDPRRYGFPKYIICHSFRRPRPCTMVLLMILAVCIILPIVRSR
ncbi:hypothetical protein BX616_010417 [Lobosporangium transversale]|uniref:Uncharacterized protein n=1 Tax=Lobosporangium transversale TaxID=64571 RepID=A0A1Y2GHU0_9FUNG|nr:hypothetical protein BCR41DRAFT_398006 [Lobosporangium transversale]KAF9912117.1 hypothetical protein BX616_010417 [Lobosporangium transversale]ORZ11338.1 hypothetical protein BCR41DRAFT_398006 [Lobosporangium transversale]|eukprot:XP_021879653.1 hypothetical protein BCR41DRAFT_398006 [Lobosporangium transversale]